jgi:hypothetical protein
MSAYITPWPREIPHALPYGTLRRGKMEIGRVERGTHMGHVAYYVHPSDNGGQEVREIVTLHNGIKHVHRYGGDTRRAMDMIYASLTKEAA